MTVGEIIRWVERGLKQEGIEESEISARQIVGSILELRGPKLLLSYKDEIDPLCNSIVSTMMEDRIRGKPIQYIIGECGFLDWTFCVGRGVFIPRPETEVLVEVAESLSPLSPTIYDIGTGCGVIGISLARLIPCATIYASDIIDLRIAEINSRRLGVEERVFFLRGSLFEPYQKLKSADIIVSNPPYIPSKEIPLLQREIRDYEPLKSLNGGEDGLYFIRKLIASAPLYLKPGGWLIFEIGDGQWERVRRLASSYFNTVSLKRDYSKRERVCVCRLE